MSGNPILAQLGANSLHVNQLIIDPRPPELSQFVTFDLD